MRRFLMFVGVAVVAAAMYVAASSASQVSNGPTAKQFAALKKQVGAESIQIKKLFTENKIVFGVLAACMQGALPIDQFGDPTGSLSGTDQGYVYATGGTGPVLGVTSYTTGLDVTSPSVAGALWITGSTGNTKCRTVLGGFAFHRAAAKAGITVQPLRLPSSFAVHQH
jgi:hypothetical protein